ncbi:hypothetical protein LXA43DRAFT_1057568 [Ganoderma leucocontextum]|nr:hypothetical protein LXA43DRAFT_1057568 [Ganoderma leucocontextum]
MSPRQGNKFFVSFSNLNDTDSLTKSWTEVTPHPYPSNPLRPPNRSKPFYENLMVDTDNAKSERGFKKLSSSRRRRAGALRNFKRPTFSGIIAPSFSSSAHSTGTANGRPPSLNVHTQSVSTRPSATPVNSSQQNSSSNPMPGGIKAEYSNCGATRTPPVAPGHQRRVELPRVRVVLQAPQCYYNCHTTASPLWRKDDEGKTLYATWVGTPNLHESDVIRKQSMATQVTSGSGGQGSDNSAGNNVCMGALGSGNMHCSHQMADMPHELVLAIWTGDACCKH